MTTINTIHDLHRILVEHPEWRSDLRRVLLTEELLTLPSQFAEMIETQNRILTEQAEQRQSQNRMLETQVTMLETQNNILAELAELRQTQDSMLETQNSMLVEQGYIRTDIHELHGMYRRQHEDMARFRGNYASDAARTSSVDIARLFARLRGLRRIYVRPLTLEERGDLLGDNYAAVDALHLRSRSWDTFLSPDYLAEVSELRARNKPLFYVAIEASFTGNREDLQRATDHARILRCATELDAYPVVASVRMNRDIEGIVFDDTRVERFTLANDENAALWYRLDEYEMEPLDPP